MLGKRKQKNNVLTTRVKLHLRELVKSITLAFTGHQFCKVKRGYLLRTYRSAVVNLHVKLSQSIYPTYFVHLKLTQTNRLYFEH